jgi:hypothetical protein
MPQMAPLPRDQRNVDADHLNLLSILHSGFGLPGILFVPLNYLHEVHETICV